MCKSISRMPQALALLALGAVLAASGCTLDLFTPDGWANTNDNGSNSNDNGSDGGGGGDSVDPTEVISIGFRNFSTTEAVRLEFYLARGAIATVPDDLFVAENLIGGDIDVDDQGLGVANQAIVEARKQDWISVQCGDFLTVGTTGGTFLDAESGEIRGVGTARWVQEGAQFGCGAVIVFEYAPDGDGFTTTLLIEH
jgi:hypothetical protein